MLADGLQLAGEAVAFYLPFAGNPEVCVSLRHESRIKLPFGIVNTNSVDIVLILKTRGLALAAVCAGVGRIPSETAHKLNAARVGDQSKCPLAVPPYSRSEEHTSELQSPMYL